MSNFARSLIATGKRFAQDESGSNAVEYGLILGLVSLTIVASATTAGTSLSSLFGSASDQLSTAASAAKGS